MKINMSVIAVSAVVMNAMFVACSPIFPMTDALDRTIEKCTFEKPEDLCFFEKPQEQIWVEKGGSTSINLLLHSSEVIGQGLNATRQNISVMDTDNNVIVNGNNVTHFLRKNWNINVDFIQESIKRRIVFIINLAVSLNYATDSEVVHFEIRYGNLIYKTGFIHINILAADRGNPTSSPASSTVSETWNNSQWSTSTATDLPTTTSTPNVPPCYQSGPSNSDIIVIVVCGFAFLAVLIKWKWISSQVMRLIPTCCQQNIHRFLHCTDQPPPSGNDPAIDLSPPRTGTGAWALEDTGTQTEPTGEPIRTESEILPPIGTGAWALETTGTQTEPTGEPLRIVREHELVQPEHRDSEPSQKNYADRTTSF